MEITVNLIKKTTLFPYRNRSLLKKIIVFSLSNLSNIFFANKKSINIILLNDNQMTYYNEKFLNHQGSTDVIAFSYLENKDELIGDIFVSLDMAYFYAEKYKTSISKECILYVIHGLLHIIGYDDHNNEDIKKMRQVEKYLMDKVENKFLDLEIFKFK